MYVGDVVCGNGVASLACKSPSFILLLGECVDVHRISTFAIYCVRSTHIDAETMCETIFHSIHSFINFIILGLVCTRNAPHSILFRFNSRATGVKISPRYNFIWLQSQTIRGNCFACDSLSSTREITMEKCWWCSHTEQNDKSCEAHIMQNDYWHHYRTINHDVLGQTNIVPLGGFPAIGLRFDL